MAFVVVNKSSMHSPRRCWRCVSGCVCPPLGQVHGKAMKEEQREQSKKLLN